MRLTNYRLEKKFNEIFLVEPNNLGNQWLNNLYKEIVSYLKTLPLLIIFPICFLIALSLFLVFKKLIVDLVSLLQNGF